MTISYFSLKCGLSPAQDNALYKQKNNILEGVVFMYVLTNTNIARFKFLDTTVQTDVSLGTGYSLTNLLIDGSKLFARNTGQNRWNEQKDKGKKGQWDNGTMGQMDKGTKGQRHKVTKGQRDQGTLGKCAQCIV